MHKDGGPEEVSYVIKLTCVVLVISVALLWRDLSRIDCVDTLLRNLHESIVESGVDRALRLQLSYSQCLRYKSVLIVSAPDEYLCGKVVQIRVRLDWRMRSWFVLSTVNCSDIEFEVMPRTHELIELALKKIFATTMVE